MTKDASSGDQVALLDDVAPLSPRFLVWFCDIWGVVHNGVQADMAACDALVRHREAGGIVILITNSPRPRPALIAQLDELNVPRGAWDDIVTSGDVTRAVISARVGAKVFHLGPEKDRRLREGLPVEITGPDKAEIVLCSGLYDDRTEQPDDYRDLLAGLVGRGLDMVCANPDLRVQHGDRIIPCGGALAALYEEMGGNVIMAGKPFSPIYEECLKHAETAAGRSVDKAEILAIGDGMATDMKGARNFGIAALYIATGVHHEELKTGGLPAILSRLEEEVPGLRLVGVMDHLVWKGDRA